MENEIFVDILLVITIILLTRYLILAKKRRRGGIEGVKSKAQDIAKEQWTLEGLQPESKSSKLTLMVKNIRTNQLTLLPWNLIHPDTSALQKEKSGQFVEFEFSGEPVNPAMKLEVCGYLWVKNLDA